MTERGDVCGEPSRHLSPDGRTVLLRFADYHPADAHQIRELLFPRVIDTESGETVLDFSDGVTSFNFAWEDDGVLRLTHAGAPFPSADPLVLCISVREGWCAASDRGGAREPLAQAQARLSPLMRVSDYDRPRPVPALGRFRTFWAMISGRR